MAPRDRLSAAFIKSAKPGKHCDGAGLWLHKRADGGAQWFLRFDRFGKRCEMGLGGFPRVSLRQARDLAELARSQLAAGIDPIKERRGAPVPPCRSTQQGCQRRVSVVAADFHYKCRFEIGT